MKILTFSTLYPSSVNPTHGIFVETRLRHLIASGKVRAEVIAPVPWFPSTHRRFGRYASAALVPRSEERNGLSVHHPRYLVLPKIGMTLAPLLLAGATLPVVKQTLSSDGGFDLIDSHYFYPDGVAAVMLGAYFAKPVVITARGSDINLIAKFRLPRRMIRWAARRAAGIITVCNALKESLVEIGVPAEKIVSLRNGVDTWLFFPLDREGERKRLGLNRVTLITVGNLVPNKGHDVALRVLPLLPEAELLIIGDGTEKAALMSLARSLDVTDRVRFLGSVGQGDLNAYYSAADVLLLPSMREGWTNVLLESMACGTPVVATRVGGTPEIVCQPEAGVLVDDRTPMAFARAVRRLMADRPERRKTREYATRFSWDSTTRGQLELFHAILEREGAHGHGH